jgi:hypothetical protein
MPGLGTNTKTETRTLRRPRAGDIGQFVQTLELPYRTLLTTVRNCWAVGRSWSSR